MHDPRRRRFGASPDRVALRAAASSDFPPDDEPMSLFSSLQLASNALQAQAIGLQVVGRNIADFNTFFTGRSAAMLSVNAAIKNDPSKFVAGRSGTDGDAAAAADLASFAGRDLGRRSFRGATLSNLRGHCGRSDRPSAA